MESRFEKFANLRAEISKQIELDQEFGEINNVINDYMLRLNEIDSNYFANVRTNFEQEFNWEKLFFDRNLENQSYNPAFKKDLETLYTNMQGKIPDLSKDYANKEKLTSDKLITNFLIANNIINKVIYKDCQTVLDDLLVKKIEYQETNSSLLLEHKNFKVSSDNLTMKEIDEIRKKDKRTIEEMIKNISSTFEEQQNGFLNSYQKFYAHKKVLFWLTIITITLIILMIIFLVLFFLL